MKFHMATSAVEVCRLALHGFSMSLVNRSSLALKKKKKTSVSLALHPPPVTECILHIQWDHDQTEPAVRVGRLAHQLLQRRGEGHVGPVEDNVGQDGIAAAGEQLW